MPARLARRGEVEILPGAGHLGWLDDEERIVWSFVE